MTADDKYLGVNLPDGSPGHVYLCARCGAEMAGHRQAYMNGIRAGMGQAARICNGYGLREERGNFFAEKIRKAAKEQT